MKVHPLWFVCLFVRVSLAVAIYLVNPFWNHTYVSLILFLMGAGFFYQGTFSSNDEIQFANVFWHDSRYIHGAFYLAAAYYLYYNDAKMASILVLSDICFSILYRIIQNK